MNENGRHQGARFFVSTNKEVRQHPSDLPAPSEIKDCVRKWLKRGLSHGQLLNGRKSIVPQSG